jgi:hypothetical protein
MRSKRRALGQQSSIYILHWQTLLTLTFTLNFTKVLFISLHLTTIILSVNRSRRVSPTPEPKPTQLAVHTATLQLLLFPRQVGSVRSSLIGADAGEALQGALCGYPPGWNIVKLPEPMPNWSGSGRDSWEVLVWLGMIWFGAVW